MVQTKLAKYLAYINDRATISLGLSSWQHLVDLIPKRSEPMVITVAGTNGKGSCVNLIAQALFAADISYAAYTSPHLYDFKERLQINNCLLTDAAWLKAFVWVEQIQDTKLSPFEFYTMAALYLAYQQKISVLILEVGLGGRFDAVNAVEPDIAIITEIDLDHTERLGSDLAAIAYQKAGIMRSGRPAIYAGSNVRSAMQAYAKEIGADLHLCLPVELEKPIALPQASALAALKLAELMPMALDMQAAIANFALPGRFEVRQLQGRTLIFDVAHNPAAMQNLAKNLRRARYQSVGLWLSLAKTKDIAGCIAELRDVVALACVSKHCSVLAHDCADVSKSLQEFGVPLLNPAETYAEPQLTLERFFKAGVEVVVIAGSFQHVGMIKPLLGLSEEFGVWQADLDCL